MIPLTGIPQFSVEFDGTPIDEDLSARLLRLNVHQRLSLPAQCEIVVAGQVEQFPDARTSWPGAEIRIKLLGKTLFTGELAALSSKFDPDGRLTTVYRCSALGTFDNISKHEFKEVVAIPATMLFCSGEHEIEIEKQS